jgi:hypothetical protein
MHWGDKHLSPDGAPALIHHSGCGHDADPLLVCGHCHGALTPRNVELKPGPGLERAAEAA